MDGWEVEYVFIDDGSSDGSSEMIKAAADQLPGPVGVVRQPNGGASRATNEGVLAARHPWIRLVDGDDCVVAGSTPGMLGLAVRRGERLIYGDLVRHANPDNPPEDAFPEAPPEEPLSVDAGLQLFIRNCPANSSSILVGRERFLASGGCDEHFVSPDQVMFLRLFASGSGVHVPAGVAWIPDQAPGRLAEQQRWSRFESVLSLLRLYEERADLSPARRKQLIDRALSRASTYDRAFHGRRLTSRRFWRHLAAKIAAPGDPAVWLSGALGAFTENGAIKRSDGWRTGADRAGVARSRVSGAVPGQGG